MCIRDSYITARSGSLYHRRCCVSIVPRQHRHAAHVHLRQETAALCSCCIRVDSVPPHRFRDGAPQYGSARGNAGKGAGGRHSATLACRSRPPPPHRWRSTHCATQCFCCCCLSTWRWPRANQRPRSRRRQGGCFYCWRWRSCTWADTRQRLDRVAQGLIGRGRLALDAATRAGCGGHGRRRR